MAVLLPIVLLLVLPNLGGYALWDPDEARHAEVAREVFTAADWRGWIVPHLNGHAYHDKPILHYWLVSAAYALGGVDERSARIVSAIAMIATVLAVYAWSAARSGGRGALAAGLVLATSLEFLALGRYASLDMSFTLWMTVGILAAERWATTTRRQWALVAGVTAGLGMLTKGLAAPLLIGAAAAGMAWVRGVDRGELGRGALSATLAGAVVAGPWYVAAGILDPTYLRVFLLQHHVGRFLGSAQIALHPKPVWFYIPVLIGGFMPWTAALPAAVRAAWKQPHPDRSFCLTWAAGIFGFFSLSSGKLGTYILPCLPPLALVVGPYLADPGERRWLAGGWWGVIGLCLATVPILLGLRVTGLNFVSVGTTLYALVLDPPAIAAMALLRRGRIDLVPIAIGIGILAGSAVFYRVAAPRISAWVSDAQLVRSIPDPTAPVIAYQIRPASLLFYLGHPVPVVTKPARLAEMIEPDRLTFVVTSPKHIPELAAAGTFYPWNTGARHVLFASQPPPS